MLKRPLAVLAALVLAVGLAGCGSDDDGGNDTASDPTDSQHRPAVECTYKPGGEAARAVDLPPADRHGLGRGLGDDRDHRRAT